MKKVKKNTQFYYLLKLMKKGRYIDLYSAFYTCGTMKLSTRISDIKKLGFSVAQKEYIFKTKYGTRARLMRYKIDRNPTNMALFNKYGIK